MQCKDRNERQKKVKSLKLWIFQYLHSLKSTQAVGKARFPPVGMKKKGKEKRVEWLRLAHMLVIYHT